MLVDVVGSIEDNVEFSLLKVDKLNFSLVDEIETFVMNVEKSVLV